VYETWHTEKATTGEASRHTINQVMRWDF